jgi:hypothetical protein
VRRRTAQSRKFPSSQIQVRARDLNIARRSFVAKRRQVLERIWCQLELASPFRRTSDCLQQNKTIFMTYVGVCCKYTANKALRHAHLHFRDGGCCWRGTRTHISVPFASAPVKCKIFFALSLISLVVKISSFTVDGAIKTPPQNWTARPRELIRACKTVPVTTCFRSPALRHQMKFQL